MRLAINTTLQSQSGWFANVRSVNGLAPLTNEFVENGITFQEWSLSDTDVITFTERIGEWRDDIGDPVGVGDGETISGTADDLVSFTARWTDPVLRSPMGGKCLANTSFTGFTDRPLCDGDGVTTVYA